MLKRLSIFGLAFLPILLSASVLFKSDFTNPPPSSQLRFVGRNSGRIGDGVLTLGKKGNGFSLVEMPQQASISGPFEISFRMRSTYAPASNYNWGVNLHREDGVDVKIYSVVGYNLSRDRKTLHNSHFEKKVSWPIGENVPFSEVKIRVDGEFITLIGEGEILGSKPLKASPIKRLSIYAYNMEIQIDDLVVERVKEEEDNSVSAPVFAADFNENADGVDEQGRPIKAQLMRGKTALESAPMGEGVSGTALQLKAPKGGNPQVSWEIGNCLGKSGAVMFWARLEGDFPKDTFNFSGWSSYLTLHNREGAEVMRFGTTSNSNYSAIRLGKDQKVLDRFAKNVMFQGDWNHFAFTWNNGLFHWYVNGIPYFPGNTWQSTSMTIPGFDPSDLCTLRLIHKACCSIDDVKIYRKKVTPEEIYREYRRCAPIDLVLPDSKVSPDEDSQITVFAAPGGEFVRPVPGEVAPITATVKFNFRLVDLAGKEHFTKAMTVKVEQLQKLKLPVGKLPVGKYLLRCAMELPSGVRSHRSFQVESLRVDKAQAESLQDLQLDKCIFAKDFTDANDKALVVQGKPRVVDNKYMEPGDHKGDRFGVEVFFEPEHIQKPLVVEITWPDDKPRMAGLYMYLVNVKGQNYRDRLQGGYQAGNEYPNSGKMITTRYIFWPQTPSSLFEVRTLANDFPAAIRSLKIYTLKHDRLPRLKLNRPEGLPGRAIGHTDEDQTLTTNMANKEYLLTLNRILEYMDYTGQEIFYYPITRYGFSFFPLPGSNGNEMWPFDPGSMPHVTRAFSERGKRFVGILNMGTLPDLTYAELCGINVAKRGLVNLNRYFYDAVDHLSGAATPNPSNPVAVKMFLRYIEDFFLGDNPLKLEALDLWSAPIWNSLENGYDDYTVEKFSRETGIQVPRNSRYEFLTAEENVETWLKWRAKQEIEVLKQVRALVDKYNPAIKIFLENRYDFPEAPYLGKMLQEVPGVYLTQLRRPTSYRHNFHWGRPESDLDERMYDYNTIQKQRSHHSNENVTIFYTYYETFTQSMMKKYGCYFQNADPKADGRYFLKELAFDLAASDALRIGFGGQPFGSFGRDWQTREFAQAYAALPALTFNTVPTENSSVTVRSLDTKNGTYFYVVSLVWQDVTVKMKQDVKCVDLSTGEEVRSGKIHLKPYQLRSFLVPKRHQQFTSYTVKFPKSLRKFYEGRVAELEESIKKLEAKGIVLAEEKERLQVVRQQLSKSDYAETHRLSFAPQLNQLKFKENNIQLVSRENEMIKKSIYAVNCGSTEPLVTKSGKFFFADRPFANGSSFGYFGNYLSVVRKIDDMAESETKELFRTEAYNMDGWKFQVANGAYNIRLYMKIGYPSDFAPEKVVFTVYAQGKPLFVEKDFAATQKKFSNPLILDFKNVQVDNGVLTLLFQQKRGLGGNIRLCNAIEIEPAK